MRVAAAEVNVESHVSGRWAKPWQSFHSGRGGAKTSGFELSRVQVWGFKTSVLGLLFFCPFRKQWRGCTTALID